VIRTLLARLGLIAVAWLVLCSPPVLGLLGHLPGLLDVPGVGVVTDAGASVWVAVGELLEKGTS
jgi:hypothetical protein